MGKHDLSQTSSVEWRKCEVVGEEKCEEECGE